MSVLVVEPDERLRTQWLRLLEQRGCEVTVARSTADAFRMVTGAEPPSLVLVGAGEDVTRGIQLCSELRRRPICEIHPQVVITGPYASPRQMLSAFEAGASDWVNAPNMSAVGGHLAIAARAHLSRVVVGDSLLALRRLGPAVTGVFRCTAGELDARVEVSRGRIGFVSLEPNSRPLMRLVENEARRRVPEVRAWVRSLPGAAEDWRAALVAWGLWDRVRLRDGLAQHSRQALRVLATFSRLAVTFEPRCVEWSDELAFLPDEVLPEAGELETPQSFTQGTLAFLQTSPANDVRVTSVS